MGAEPEERTDSQAAEPESEPSTDEGSSPDTTSNEPDRSPGSASERTEFGAMQSNSIQRSASAGGAGGGRAQETPGASGTVDFDSGPDHAGLSDRYGMTVRSGEGAKLQRLEKEFGSAKVQRWADEGMTVDTMGKARDMKAFRQRQEGRPEEVPTDIERRNEASVHRNSDGGETGPAGNAGAPESVRNVVSSPGKSMDDSVQGEMESKMGGDFSDVQVHTGPKAAAAADSINARAFTVGNHVAFNSGEYQPDTDSGKEVLAHELTHVRQQTSGAVSMLPAEDAQLEIDPDPKLEKEAEETAETVTNDGSRTVRRMGTEMHVQRLPEAMSTSAMTAGGADSVAIQRDSGADSGSSDGGGGNVKTTHVVQPGETLQGIASKYGIKNMRAIWKQNHEEIDNPNLIFPKQKIEIPADEEAVPDKNLGSPEGEPTPAPKNDMRDEKPAQKPPEGPEGGKEETGESEGDADLEEAKEKEVEQPSEPPEAGGVGTRALGPDSVREIGDIPESASESPDSAADDPALQETVNDVETGIDEVVDEDVSGEAGDTKAPELAGNAKEASNKPPEEDKGEDQTEQVSILDEEQSAAPDFDKSAFKDTMKQRVDEVTPDTIEDVEGFGDDDSLDNLEDDMQQEVDEEKDKTKDPVKKQAEAGPPDTPDTEEDVDLDKPKPEDEVQPDAEAAAGARPDPRSREEVEKPMDDVKKDIDEPLEDKEFDEKDMQQSPHEEFSEPGKEAEQIKQDAEQTKGEVRESEAETLAKAEGQQAQQLEQGTSQLNQQRDESLQQVAQDQEQAKSQDESARQEVFQKVNSIYKETEKKVDQRLTEMEEDVQTILNEKFASVRQQFEKDVEKAKEQSQGFASWFKRTFWMGDDMNENFERARQKFVTNTKEQVIDAVAERVAQGMKEVGEAIKEGQQKIEEYLNSLPEERQQVAQEAAQMMSEKFAGLKNKAQQAKQQISDNVIQTYEKNLEEVETELKEAKEEVEEARWDFKPPFVETIEEITGAFSTLIDAIGDTASSAPSWGELFSLDFSEVLSNIGDTIGDVFDYFMDWGNIIKTMFSGLLRWLEFDKLVDGFEDITLPEGITDVSGITAMGWDIFTGLIGGDYLQGRVQEAWSGDQFVVSGEKVQYVEGFFKLLEGGIGVVEDFKDAVKGLDENIDMSLFELAKGIGMFGVSLLGGAASGMKQAAGIIVEQIMKTDVVNLLDAVLEQAISFVTTQLIKAAVSKLKALAGPVGAALELVENVYKFVMFIIDNASRYIGLIKSFAQFVFGIIKGATSRAADLLIDGIKAALPMLFDFIAKAIAGTGVDQKIQDVFMTGKEKVDEFMDWAASQLEPVLKPITKALYPVFFGAPGAEAKDEEEADSDKSKKGGRSKRKSSDGDGDSSDKDSDRSDEDSKKGWKQKATDKMKKASEALDDKTGDLDVDASKIGLEQMMYAVDLTVQAEQGSIGSDGARQVMVAAELQQMMEENDLDPSAFVQKGNNAYRIRQALVEQLASQLEPGQVQEEVDSVKPENVWDEDKKEFKTDYQSMAGSQLEQATDAKVAENKEQRRKRREMAEGAREEMLQLIDEESDQDINMEEWREDFEYMSEDKVEAVTGKSIEELYEQSQQRRESHLEAAFHEVKANEQFATGEMSDQEIMSEISDMSDEEIEAITGMDMNTDRDELEQRVKEAREKREQNMKEAQVERENVTTFMDGLESVPSADAKSNAEIVREILKNEPWRIIDDEWLVENDPDVDADDIPSDYENLEELDVKPFGDYDRVLTSQEDDFFGVTAGEPVEDGGGVGGFFDKVYHTRENAIMDAAELARGEHLPAEKRAKIENRDDYTKEDAIEDYLRDTRSLPEEWPDGGTKDVEYVHVTLIKPKADREREQVVHYSGPIGPQEEQKEGMDRVYPGWDEEPLEGGQQIQVERSDQEVTLSIPIGATPEEIQEIAESAGIEVDIETVSP